MKITDQVNIKASLDKVWKAISVEGNLNNCHPFCKFNHVVNWDCENSEDQIEYYNGLILTRKFTNWDPNKGYELKILKNDLLIALVNWEIISNDKGYSNLIITIDFKPKIILNKYPIFLHSLLIKYFLKPRMLHYLRSVLLGFKYYIETGNIVVKNQFGLNKMFSN